MFLKILFIATSVLLSCGSAAKEASALQQQTNTAQKLVVLSATETDWIGGVQGVRGKIFTIRIKSTLKQKVSFSSIEINGKRNSVSAIFKNNIYTVTARTSEGNPQPDADAAPGSNKILPAKYGILYYTESYSKTVKKLSVTKFTHVENVLKSGDEPVQ